MPPESEVSIPGINTLLVGETGTGKTHSLKTLIDAGVTPFVLFTEQGIRTLADIACDKLHYKYVPPAATSWDDMISTAKKINTMSFEQLSKLKDIDKRKFGQWLDMVGVMNNFVCDRCGEGFGDVADWNTDRAICVDSLSGLNIMAMDLVVGSKPTKAMNDWGVAMDNLERFINNMCSLTKCHFVMIAHLERETNEITGGIFLTVSSLGKKLPPKIPRFFDDVIMCQREETIFSWSTAEFNVALKGRNVPISKTLLPSFQPLIKSWQGAGGNILPTKTKDLPQLEPITGAI